MSAERSRRIDATDIYHNTRAVRRCSLDPSIRCLAELRASQINGGCDNCENLRVSEAEALGIDADKLRELARWADSDRFSARERAALAWCESFTHFRPVDSGTRKLAITTFSPRELADLTLAIELTGTMSRVARHMDTRQKG
ncbi:carboxymuconolactone decarboxylase family protein [Kushneria aurantia]|uniref:Carboxymuconolactone decarboxylase family protein n=1 Tax=Kushneria aurantia TaxID=504092 RepID=A0ABV6G3Q4_9GAMM|nr:carboxymuconolactone decarboxylase family protein [Kushneria aurantia]